MSAEGDSKTGIAKLGRSLHTKYVNKISAESKQHEVERDNLYIDLTMSEFSNEIVELKELELKQKSHSKHDCPLVNF